MTAQNFPVKVDGEIVGEGVYDKDGFALINIYPNEAGKALETLLAEGLALGFSITDEFSNNAVD